jgi:hypothetical protein
VPYVLENLTDGQEPSVRAIGSADDAPEGAVVVEEAPLAGWIWDAAAKAMRERTQTEALSYARAQKEAELRDAADAWYRGNIRSFEGAIVTAKYGRSGLTALNAEERAIFDEMNANYTKLKNLIGQVRVAASLEDLEGISW